MELVKLAELFYKHKIPLRWVLLVRRQGGCFIYGLTPGIYNLYHASESHFTCKLNTCFLAPSFRIGFVFVVNPKDEIDGFSDAGVAFYRLLNYISDEYDLSQALMSMLSVSIPHI